jgi:carbonic anhydrase
MSAEPAATPNTLSPTQAWSMLKAGNKRFVHGELRARDPLAEREAVAYAPSPKAVVLTCGDSRIAPEIVFDSGLGELFVVRTAAGIADTVSLGAIEFAVQTFQIPLVIVMAHQRCGAVTLACSGEKVTSPHMNRFVKAIRPLIPKRDLSPDGIEQVIRRNAMHIASDLTHRSMLLHDAVHRGEVQILAAYYWLDTGEVVRL